jgi:hypothetical protein
MKRKIAILLAAVMTAAVLPMNVMASSSNSVNKTVTVSVDDYINDVYLKIQPNDEIVSGDSIEITVKNAEFVDGTEEYDNNKIEQYSQKSTIANGNIGFDDWMELYCERAYTDPDTGKLVDADARADLYNSAEIYANSNNALPYKIIRRSKTSIEVKLFPIAESLAGKDNSNSTKPYYYIPLNLKAKEEGDIQVTVDANEAAISGGGTYTIASSTDSDGSTTTTISEVNYFEDDIILEDITVKENVKGTFDLSKNTVYGTDSNGNKVAIGAQVKLRLSGGFVFSTNQSEFQVVNGINAAEYTVTAYDVDDDTLTFNIPVAWTDTDKASSFIIQGLKVLSDDDDKWGDVNVTISGAGITKETIKVAERADYGFAMTLEEEVPTLYAGRNYLANTSELDEDDNEAAEVKFEELIENTYIGERALQFSVPEGIKIFGFEINDSKYFNFGSADFKIKEDGTVLEIGKGVTASSTDTSEFKLKLYISADADFEGDVTLSVKGAGVGEGVVDDVVIAKVVTPITVSAEPTVTNLGYQSITTSDITITEATDGILLKDEKVYVELDAAFGGSEIGFSDSSDLDYEITGDLQIKNFKVDDGAIEFTVDKTSYTEPSTITIKNVAIGSTRSVPYGAYDLKVSGPAIINNYVDDVDDVDQDYPVTITEDTNYDDYAYFDTTDSYSFNDYLTIKTVTGTFDDVVEVTIGESTCVVNGEAYDMGVAPYIQATSNSTMVPLRFVSVALGVDSDSLDNPDASDRVVWNSNTKTVTLYYGQGTGQKIVQFTAGSNNMIVDGNPIAMDYGVVAEITDDRMFVPFRALGNALGIKVTWDADTKTATYSAY